MDSYNRLFSRYKSLELRLNEQEREKFSTLIASTKQDFLFKLKTKQSILDTMTVKSILIDQLQTNQK